MNVLLVSSSNRFVSEVVSTFMPRGMTVFHYPNAEKCLSGINEQTTHVFGSVLIDYASDPGGAVQLLKTMSAFISRSHKKTGIFLKADEPNHELTLLQEKYPVQDVIYKEQNPEQAFQIVYSYRKNIIAADAAEKRYYFRISPGVGESVSVYCRSEDNRLVSETMQNISPGGLLISNKQGNGLFRVGNELNFQMNLLQRQINFEGEIVFSQGALVGVKYTKITQDDRICICKYIFQQLNAINLAQYIRLQEAHDKAADQCKPRDENPAAEAPARMALTPLIKKYNLADLEMRPLPFSIYNAGGTIMAQQGQKLSRTRLQKSYFYSQAEKDIFDVSKVESINHQPLSKEYAEESAAALEKRMENLDFVPYAAARDSLRTDMRGTKNIFETKLINNVTHLNSRENDRISRIVAQSMDEVMKTHVHATDYMDMVHSLRNKDNYLTFSHSCSVAFYSLAIARKLEMLKQDFLLEKNIGRWLSVKTRKNPESVGARPFSMRLLKYIDLQKITIALKYKDPAKNTLMERLTDIMHEYTAIDFKEAHDSLNFSFTKDNLEILAMAALNHDIGKISIPNRILNKPEKLSDEEFAIMQEHPAYGINRLREVGVNRPKMFGLMLCHHYLNGKSNRGYPKVGERAVLGSRIIAIADIYDAMRSETFYHRPKTQDEVFVYLRDLYEDGCFDYPLYICARHTFEEFNHDYVKERFKQIQK